MIMTAAKFLLLLSLASFSWCQDHGVQMRLTKKGMSYAVDMGIAIMKNDLKKISINKNGVKGDIKYVIKNLRVNHLHFDQYILEPVKGTGMKGVVSGININATGLLGIKYGWFFSDKTKLTMTSSGINFQMAIKIGADANGRATLEVDGCGGSVDEIGLSFSGGMSLFYNLLSPFIVAELKLTFQELLCEIAIKEINTKAKQELATFPVVKNIDGYAEIDYRLTSPPKFTNDYMDAFLKGEFKEAKNAKSKVSVIPTFQTGDEYDKMVYFWVTDYTLNTAGTVYHDAGKLQVTANAWDEKVPDEIKSLLHTTKFIVLFPKLLLKYPNEPMGVKIVSYKAPTSKISPDEIHFKLYALATFSVKSSSKLFTIKFDITAGANINVKKTNITVNIVKFNYDASVTETTVGNPTVSLDNTFVRNLIDMFVIKNGNEFLQTGFPLPKVDEVTFKDFEVKLIKDAISIGTDLQYINSKELQL